MRIKAEEAERIVCGFGEHAESGYCPDCDEFVGGPGGMLYEPDARGYPCEECDGNRAMGACEAIMSGMVAVE